jgi:hypothetical protein
LGVEVEVEVEGDARVSDNVRAKGVSSRMDNESGRVEGVIECHVDGDGLAMVIFGYKSIDRVGCRSLF